MRSSIYLVCNILHLLFPVHFTYKTETIKLASIISLSMAIILNQSIISRRLCLTARSVIQRLRRTASIVFCHGVCQINP